jgi:hypothetical protein
MEETKPHQLSASEWREIMAIPAVRESWGIDDDTTLAEFRSQVYAVKCDFISGSPGYVGDLFIVQGDTLTVDAPFVLRRDPQGQLIFV